MDPAVNSKVVSAYSPGGGDVATLLPIPKCGRCRASLKPRAAFCSRCGLSARSGAAEESGARGIHWPLIAVFASCLLLIAALVFALLASKAPPQPTPPMTAVYINPPPAPAPPVPVDLPIEKPAFRPPRIAPTTQIVQLPKETHYMRLKTQMLGATTGGGPYQVLGSTNEPVIGFRVTTADWGGKSIVRNLQPVYPSDNSVVTRSMVVARPGYAVGGVIVDGDDHVTAMRVVFMRIQPHSLSVKDAYESDWIGQPTGDPTNLLGGRGQFVIGIYGRKGMNVDALGLILMAETLD